MDAIQVVFPAGALGANKYDSVLDTFLRELSVKASTDSGEWAEKYSTQFDNDVFMLHRYCWCEREDCAWCSGCNCPSSAFHYFVDGKEVGYRGWADFFQAEMKSTSKDNHDKWMKMADAVNKRRTTRHDPICEFCKTGGVARLYGGEPGKAAPNFWYKPLDFKVHWYKYVGRDTEPNKKLSKSEFEAMKKHCFDSIGKTQ
jgi:hypothetical protein